MAILWKLTLLVLEKIFKIGNNVKIGANAIVTQDLPDNCTVVTKGSCIVRLSGEKVRIDL